MMRHVFSPVAVLLLAVLAVQPYAAEIIATNAAAITAAPPPSVFDQQMMAPYAVRNRGFGGSTMAQVLLNTNHFLQYQSRLVVVYEGDNNFCNPAFTPHAFLAECRRFTELMLAAVPGRNVLFLSVKPSPSRWCFFERQSAANALLRAYALRTPRVHFIDIVPALLGNDFTPNPALYVQDQLHLNEAGYARIAAVIKAALQNN